MKLLVSALEYSANVHLKTLKLELDPTTELIGIFDKGLGEPIIDLQSQAVMGYVDAIKKLRFYLKLADQMTDLADEVDKVLLIDASGFNLPLAKRIKKRYPDKEIIYYILPEAWAWKPGRIAKLEARVDKLVSIIPFEKELYSPNAPITYVGHPLLDQLFHCKAHLVSEIQNITFMPGSRKSIIRKLMPVFHEARKQITATCSIVVPKYFSTDETNELYGNLSEFEVTHDAHEALYRSDFAFICKGTATLEASLIGVPFVLVYKFAHIDYLLFRHLVTIKHLGLGNILLKHAKGITLHPELIQHDVTAKKLMESMVNMDREKFFEASQALRIYLKHGSAKNVAAIIEGRDA